MFSTSACSYDYQYTNVYILFIMCALYKFIWVSKKMHCDLKKFQHGGDEISIVNVANITASVYGTTMTLSFSADEKTRVITAISEANIPFTLIGVDSLSIRTPLHDTANIKKTLDVLSSKGLMAVDFAQGISSSYPNGHGGTMNLDRPAAGVNVLLMLAASNIYTLNERLSQEARQKNEKQENNDTSCGFKH